MSQIDLVLQPLQGQDHVVFDHDQNKIAEDKEVRRVDHFCHRICHLKLGPDPMRSNPLALRALAEKVFPPWRAVYGFGGLWATSDGMPSRVLSPPRHARKEGP